MKLKTGFVTYASGGQKYVVSADSKVFSGLVRGNETAGMIIDCLAEDTTEDKIVSRLLEVYDAPEEVIRKDVNKIITKLREIGAIEN